MKTIKIITAVLAVFLVAALFIGAGAAADPASGDTVYVYQYNGNGALAANTYYLYQNGQVAGSVTSDATTGAFLGEGIVEGTYDASAVGLTAAAFILKYPKVTLEAYKAGSGSSIVGTTVLKSQNIDLSVSGTNDITYCLKFTTPAGGITNGFGEKPLGTPLTFASSLVFVPAGDLSGIMIDNVASGEWAVKAELSHTGLLATDMVVTTPLKYLTSSAIKFTVGADVTESISVNSEKIIRGGSVLVTITGTPGAIVPVTINALGFVDPAGQSGINTQVYDVAGTGYLKSFNVVFGDSGTRTLQFDSNTLATAAEDTTYNFAATFPVTGVTKKAKVTVEKGVITVTAGQYSYYLGNDITLSGTNTESEVVYLFIKGSNAGTVAIAGYSGATPIVVKADKTWEVTFNTRTTLGSLDPRTYTIYAAASAGPAPMFAFDANSVYETTSITLKQPFLTATAASSTVARGDAIKITGTAEAATTLQYYVFGTNYFGEGRISPAHDATYSKEVPTKDLDAGQCFVVIQHPMYDGVFNVAPFAQTTVAGVTTNYAIVYNSQDVAAVTGINPVAVAGGNTILFYTLVRQSANAAEGLCYELDSQNIDDIYVKLQFIVATPVLCMNSISDVVKGQPLKVSGTTNLKEGTVVTVDVLSTAFTAVEKTTVGSASFITLTTKVVKGADGVNTWEVTFDTTGLNVDTYTIKAITDDLSTSTVIKILSGKPPVIPADEITLRSGWNFISVPKMLNQTANTAGTLFGSVDTDDKNILGYDPIRKSWVPLGAADIIQPLNGYWIYAATGTTISLTYPSAPTPPSVKTLSPGWNAIGLSAGESTSAKTALAGTSWRTLIPWNLAGSKYDPAIVNGGSDANSPNRFMMLGNGYWLYVDAQSTLVALIA